MKTHLEKEVKSGDMIFITTSESDGMMCTVLMVNDSGFDFRAEGEQDYRGRFENGEIIRLVSYNAGIELIRKPLKVFGCHHVNSSPQQIFQGIMALENERVSTKTPNVTKHPEDESETVNYLPEEVKSVFVKPKSGHYDGTWQINLRDADNQTIVPLFFEMPDDSPVSSSSMAIGIGKVINWHLLYNQSTADPSRRLPEPDIEADDDPSP